MHGHLFRDVLRVRGVGADELGHHADPAAGVDVRSDRAVGDRLVAREAPDGDVLLDRADHLLRLVRNGFIAAGPLLVVQLIDRVGLAVQDGLRHFRGEIAKALGARDEVGLAVDLHQHAGVVLYERGHRPLGGDSSGLLARGGQSLLAEDRAGLLHVAVRLDQRGLDVHHPGPGLLAQLLDHLCRNLCHCVPSDKHTKSPSAAPGDQSKSRQN